MGFDVLAFESGIYDCDRAWKDFLESASDESIEKNDPGLASARLGVFGIWTGSRQTGPLWEYLADQANSPTPLELAGYDCQFTASATSRFLTADLETLVAKLGVDLTELEIDALKQGCQDLGSFKDASIDESDFHESIDKLIEATSSVENPTPDIKHWHQVLKSIKALADYRWSSDDSDTNISARDAQMAKNLIWLHKEKFPGRKIIVWAASFHIARNLDKVEPVGGTLNYDTIVPMGHLVHKELGDDVFSIAFTASEGKAGPWMNRGFTIEPPSEGTFEDICDQAGLENAWIQLKSKSPDAVWLKQPLVARPLGYRWMKAKWHQHFDAVIFNREMTKSTR